MIGHIPVPMDAMGTNYSGSLAPAHLLSADSALIIDYRDLGWKYPELIQSTYFQDVGGTPWFTMASLVITARMQGLNDAGHFHTMAEEIFESVDWPMPANERLAEMAELLSSMDRRTAQFVQAPNGQGQWIAVNLRSPSTVVFYYIRNAYTNPSFTGTGFTL